MKLKFWALENSIIGKNTSIIAASLATYHAITFLTSYYTVARMTGDNFHFSFATTCLIANNDNCRFCRCLIVGSASITYANILLYYHWRHYMYQKNIAYGDIANCALRTVASGYHPDEGSDWAETKLAKEKRTSYANLIIA